MTPGTRAAVLLLVFAGVLMRACVAQLLAVTDDSNTMCATQVCCRDQYKRTHATFDWCVLDVDVDASGSGCVMRDRCVGAKSECDGLRRQCLAPGSAVGTAAYTAALFDGCVGGCGNGIFCDGREWCDTTDAPGGTCVNASAPACDAGEHCFETAPPGNQCQKLCTTDADCLDDNYCNGVESCQPSTSNNNVLVCHAGSGPCPAGSACLNDTQTCTDGCDPALCNNQCTGTNCDSATNICTPNYYTAVSCSVSQMCDPANGCVNCTVATSADRCDDGDGCTMDSCVDNACQHVEECPPGLNCVASIRTCEGSECIESVRTCQVLCNLTNCSPCDGNSCDTDRNTCVNVRPPVVCAPSHRCNVLVGACQPIPCTLDSQCPDNGIFCDGLSECNRLIGECHVVPQCAGVDEMCLEDLRQCNNVCAVDADCSFPESTYCDKFRPCDRVRDYCLTARPRCNPVNETCDPFNRDCAPGGATTPSSAVFTVNGRAVFLWVTAICLFVFVFCILCFALLHLMRPRSRRAD